MESNTISSTDRKKFTTMLSTRFVSYFHRRIISNVFPVTAAQLKLCPHRFEKKMDTDCSQLSRGHRTGLEEVPLSTTLWACRDFQSSRDELSINNTSSLCICTRRLPIMSLDLVTGGGAIRSVTLHYKIIDWTSPILSSHCSEPEKIVTTSCFVPTQWILRLTNHGKRFTQNAVTS